MDSCAFHATGQVDCVSPDVILRFLGSDHSSHYWSMADANTKCEAVERLLVDVVQFGMQTFKTTIKQQQ